MLSNMLNDLAEAMKALEGKKELHADPPAWIFAVQATPVSQWSKASSKVMILTECQCHWDSWQISSSPR